MTMTALLHGLRRLLRRASTERDLHDEVESFLSESIAHDMREGSSPEDATRRARASMGSVTSVKQVVRSGGWEAHLERLLQDVGFGVRALRRSPGFTLVAVLTLALGIGATTAIFSVVNGVLFAPLPYPAPDRIVMINELNSSGVAGRGTFGMYRGIIERTRSFEAMAVLKPWQPTMTGADHAERLEGQRVSASYFRVLGVSPALGAGFREADDRLNGARVVILSDALWRRRFDGDSAIVGRTITLNDGSFVVVGVMPRSFEDVLMPAAQVWSPLQYDLTLGTAWGHHLRTVGRLAPGVSVEQASRELDALGKAVLAAQRPTTYGPGTSFMAIGLRDELTRGVRPMLFIIMGAMLLVLAIACVNVTNLLLARGAQRRGELALRTALGAGRGRIVRQMLTENIVLAALGGVAGIIVAMLGVRALLVLSPAQLPRVGAIHVDGVVMAFGLFITSLTGLAFGLAPALHAVRSTPQKALQHGSRRATGGDHSMRRALVVAEVGLALVVLVSSGLLLRSLERLFAVPPGFASSHLMTMQVQESGRRFTADSARLQFFSQALEAAQHVPGVVGAALTSQLPLSGDLDEYGARFDAVPGEEARGTSIFRYGVSPRYLETMRIPLVRGRLLDEHDDAGAPMVALISASLATRQFPGQDPVGHRVHVGGGDSPDYTIVGVVGDVRQQSLSVTESDAVYVTMRQWRWADNVMSLVVRTRGDPTALAPALRAAVWSVDKDQPIVRVATMDDLLGVSAAERRFALVLFEAFALAALALAAAGIYGVLSGSVAERTREIGVRLALGASPMGIVRLIVREGMTLAGLGVVLGLLGAVAASQALVAMLFGVSPLDPVTYLGVIVLLVTVAGLASWIPAWRAARVDPAITLQG